MKIEESLKRAYRRFVGDRKNIIFGGVAVSIPILYECFGVLGTEHQMVPHTFPATLTNQLQSILGTEGVAAHCASYYYFFIQLLVLGGLGGVVFFSKKPWIYLLAVITCFLIDSVVYLCFPLAPPVRTGDAAPIRLLLFPLSDTVITAKYSAFPSGHIMASFLAYLICKSEGFTRTKILYGVNTCVMSVVIVYLGEHYLIDAFGGLLLAIIGLKGAQYISEIFPSMAVRG